MEGGGINLKAVGDLVAVHAGVAVGQELGVQIRRRGVGPGQVLFLREVDVRPQTDDDAEDVLDAHARRVHGLVVYLVLERAFVPRTGFSDVHRLREDGIPVDGERVTRVTEDVVQVFQLLVQFAIVHEPVVLVRPVGRAVREQDMPSGAVTLKNCRQCLRLCPE